MFSMEEKLKNIEKKRMQVELKIQFFYGFAKVIFLIFALQFVPNQLQINLSKLKLLIISLI